MSIKEEMETAIANLPEIKSFNETKQKLVAYLDADTPVVEMFAKPFPTELISDVQQANKDRSERRNQAMVKQVWEIVINLPVAPVPSSMKRRKMM